MSCVGAGLNELCGCRVGMGVGDKMDGTVAVVASASSNRWTVKPYLLSGHDAPSAAYSGKCFAGSTVSQQTDTVTGLLSTRLSTSRSLGDSSRATNAIDLSVRHSQSITVYLNTSQLCSEIAATRIATFLCLCALYRPMHMVLCMSLQMQNIITELCAESHCKYVSASLQVCECLTASM